MPGRNMDERYDEVAKLQAQAWKKLKEQNLSNVEDTAEWKQARSIASEISIEEAIAKAKFDAEQKAARKAAKDAKSTK